MLIKNIGTTTTLIIFAALLLLLPPFVISSRRHHSRTDHHQRLSQSNSGGGFFDRVQPVADQSATAGAERDVCAIVPAPLWCGCDKLETQCGTGQMCNRYAGAMRNEPLHITLLYEGLCPDCQSFITSTLFDVYQKFKAYIRIELIPFGNALIMQNGTIKCQHGAEECRINKFHSCAIHFMHDPMPFIYCLESLIKAGISLEKAAKKCYAKFHEIPHVYDQIIHCFNGPTGDNLQKIAGQRTTSIWPDQHEYVPWILVNNVSLQATQFLMNGLPTLICLSRVGMGDGNNNIGGGEASIPGCEPL